MCKKIALTLLINFLLYLSALNCFAFCKNAILNIPNASYNKIGATLDGYDITVGCNTINYMDYVTPEGMSIFKISCIDGNWRLFDSHKCEPPPFKPIYTGIKNLNCNGESLNIGNAVAKYNNVNVLPTTKIMDGTKIDIQCNAGYYATINGNVKDSNGDYSVDEESIDNTLTTSVTSYQVLCSHGVFYGQKNCNPICSIDKLNTSLTTSTVNYTKFESVSAARVLSGSTIKTMPNTGEKYIAAGEVAEAVCPGSTGIEETGEVSFKLECKYEKICYADDDANCELTSFFALRDATSDTTTVLNKDMNDATSEVILGKLPICKQNYQKCKYSDIDTAVTKSLLSDDYNMDGLTFAKNGISIRLTCNDSVFRTTSALSTTYTITQNSTQKSVDVKLLDQNSTSNIVDNSYLSAIDQSLYNSFTSSSGKSLITLVKLDQYGRQYLDIICRGGLWEPKPSSLQCPGETKTDATVTP